MRSLFEDLVRDGASAVRSLAGRTEEIDFDCKLKADATKGAVDRDDKANLGKTLSAFSNSMGGLLLWGGRRAQRFGWNRRDYGFSTDRRYSTFRKRRSNALRRGADAPPLRN